jgi:hypothetical protein
MNWETFLLNQFLIDCEEVQDKGTEFHYSWLLILIAVLSSWREPDDSQFLGVKEKPCLAMWYQNLWYTTHKVRQMDSNVTFYIYKETIRDNIKDTMHTTLKWLRHIRKWHTLRQGITTCMYKQRRTQINSGCQHNTD